ncbi:MAG: hypothetical protein IKD09_01460 [Lentisphaeria bacterium]|nr:hypothetical protein [Lentisphaeria bacterium]
MKKFLAILFSSLISFNLISANTELSQQAAFDATMKEIDLGGLALQYQKLDNLEATATSLADLLLMNAANSKIPQFQLELFSKTLHEIIKKANLNEIKSIGASVKQINNSTFISKSFILTADNPQGVLYDAIGRVNRPFNYLNIVPENAILAGSSHIDMAVIYNSIYNNYLKNDPMASQYIQLLEMQLGMPFADFMKSLSGEYVYFATTEITENNVSLQGLIRIPDNNGNLTKFLKTLLQTEDNIVNLPIREADGMVAPILVFGNKSVIISTNQIALNQSIKAQDSGKNIRTIAKFAEYGKYLANNGISQFYLALDDSSVQLLNSLLISNNINEKFEPIYLTTESTVQKNGYKSIAVSSFNMASIDEMIALQSAIIQGAIAAQTLQEDADSGDAEDDDFEVE